MAEDLCGVSIQAPHSTRAARSSAYTVNDYARYGLPPPPYGCVWVWLNGDVALIDPSDGYILDIARNVW